MFKDIASVVASMCVNPVTKRPYPIPMIESAMKDQIHFSVKPNRNSKQQALEVISQLKEAIPIERAQMRLRILIQRKEARKLREKVTKMVSKVESEEWDNGALTIICLIDPGQFRQLDELIQSETKGSGLLELLSLKEVAEGDEILE